MDLKGKVAVVTGGRSGIGASIVLELAKGGCSVVIDYHSHPEGAEEVEKQVVAMGAKAVSVKADVSKNKDLETLVNTAVEKFGRLDVMVNNAGMETRTSILDTTEEQYEKVIHIPTPRPWPGRLFTCAALYAPHQANRSQIVDSRSL